MNSLAFSVCSLFYIFLIVIVYYSKKRIDYLENKIYSILIVVTLVGVLLDNISFIINYLGVSTSSIIYFLLTKSVLIYFMSWMYLFVMYVFVISKKDKTFNACKRLIKILTVIFFASVLCVIALPMYFNTEKNAIFPYGPAVNGVYIISFIGIFAMIIVMLCNIRSVNIKKFFPLFIFMFLGIIATFIQYMFPSMILLTSVEAFVTFLMYFTLENPDMKMIEELNIARNQADKANRAKTEFLSNMSHEIRTPLNAITGLSQVLSEEEGLPSKAKEDVKDIIMASDSLLEIVNGILDISKIEAGKLEIVNTTYHPYQILNELVVLTKARLGNEKPIEFRTHFSEDIPDTLYGDYARVKQVILNILTNAVKYTEKGSIDFYVNSVIHNDVCRLIIAVEDTGIGIKKDKIDKLFDKFTRFDEERNITIEGTGLGLAITKKLVELMHGGLVVQSVYGKGSKFTVSIDQRIVTQKAQEKKEIVSNEIKIYPGKKVLIVDDNKLNLKVAGRLLVPYKVDITSVMSGQECLDKVASEYYDLILLDDMMPVMSGKQTFAKLKENPDFKTPVVVLTANAVSGMKEDYLALGFDDYLAKPINKKELDEVLDKYLTKEEK